MATLKITELEIPEVKVIEPTYFEDFRGYYCETYSSRTMSLYGINVIFVQDNHILTAKKNTIRGIHFQNNPHAQSKLVRCTKGRVMDYAVDLRRDSRTFKQWVSIELSSENRKQLWIPSGFGHALITLDDDTEIQYKVSQWYNPELDRAIIWNDPDIAINWSTTEPIVSVKDMQAPTLRLSDVNFTLKENY